MRLNVRCLLLLAACTIPAWGLGISPKPVRCEEPKVEEESFESIEAVIGILREKGVIRPEEADAFLERYRKSKGRASAETKGTEPSLTPSGKTGTAAGSAPASAQDVESRPQGGNVGVLSSAEDSSGVADWVRRIRWGGDIRLRYDGDFFDENNALLLQPDNPSELMNTRVDRHRGRVRARLLMKAQVNDSVEFAARLSTGNEKDPVSTNETFGDYMTNGNVVFDQLYLHWKPIPEVSIHCGRIPNPWFCSDLVWDPDLNFEGLSAAASVPLTPKWKGFLTAGLFPLQEIEFSKKDKWLYAGQAGVEWNPSPTLGGKIGFAYYSYENITGQVNDPLRPGEKDWTAPLFQQKGNTLMDIDPSAGIKTALASDYDEFNVTASVDVGAFDPIHVVFLADYVINLGFDRREVIERSGNPDVKKQTQGYQVGVTVGHPRVRSFAAWNASLFYKCLEADAVLDAFTDSDFYLGGTNVKGWVLGGEFGLAKNIWARGRWFTADEVEGPPLAIDVLLIDLNASF